MNWSEIWLFMKQYADSFWAQGEFAYEIFEVLMAWFLTIGCGFFLVFIVPAIGYAISYMIKHWEEIKEE